MPDRVPVRATRNGGLDFVEVPTKDEAIVAALLDERRGYLVRGLVDRVALVDAELARFGAVAPHPADKTPARRSKR